MNLGECPYDGCDGFLALKVPERTPAYALEECPKCKRPIWYRFSRFDPQAWRKEDFEAAHDIDETTRTITRKPAPPQPTGEERP
jgi:hypothetical protein